VLETEFNHVHDVAEVTFCELLNLHLSKVGLDLLKARLEEFLVANAVSERKLNEVAPEPRQEVEKRLA